jgi:hypothetical protein
MLAELVADDAIDDASVADEHMLPPGHILVAELGNSGFFIKAPHSKLPYCVVHEVWVNSPMDTLFKACKAYSIEDYSQHSREDLMKVFDHPCVLADIVERPHSASVHGANPRRHGCCSVM